MTECEHLARTTAYFDGALPEAEQAAALEHLAGCAECQAALGDAVVLDAVVSTAPRAAAPAAAPASRGWLRTVALVGGLAAAAAVAYVVWPRPGGQAQQVALELPRERAIEARFTGARFATYRPYGVLRGDRVVEPIPLATLAQLEKRGDRRELFAALVATGDLARAEQVADELPHDATGESDRAALAIATREPEAALDHASQALALEPNLSAARWNLGLAARELGLLHVSRAAFAQIATLGEAGWAGEASAQVARLDRELASTAARAAFHERARAMVAGGPPLTADDVTRFPAAARGYLLDALRVASGDGVKALRPLAEALDAASGTTTLVAAADRAAAGAPSVRARFVERYRALAAGGTSREAAEQLVAELRAAGRAVDDLRAGAILHGGLAAAHLDELRAIVAPWHDPWFDLAVERARIQSAFAPGDAGAEPALTAALASCDNPAWSLRCGELADDLARRLVAAGRAADAERWALRALAAYDLAGSRAQVSAARSLVADIHRATGRAALARAELDEIALADRAQGGPPSP